MIGDLIRIRYQVLEELPSSPIFENFVARDRVRNMDVCVRLVRQPFASEPDFVQALGRVVQNTKKLDHPNIVRVLEIDEHDGQPFVVCELIRGATLAERIRRLAPFSPSVAVEIGIGICEALEHAAMAGVSHGDLCAEHVFATLEGRIAVADFGLWECYSASQSAGGVVLSRMAPYLAPEVIGGEMPSFASDVYAVGVMLFELLTGLLPYSGLTTASIIAKHTTQPVPSARAMNPAVPHVLDEIIQKALAKDERERYDSASSILGDLRKLLDALRFGKGLDFPLETRRNFAPSPKPVQTYAEKKAERQASTAAAVEDEQEDRPKRWKSRRIPLAGDAAADDVPKWLQALVWAASGMIVLLAVWYVFLNVTQKKQVVTPNVVGMSEAEARKTIKSKNLEFVVAGEEYNDRFPQPKSVIFMDPPAGTPVKEGATIQVKLSLGSRLVEVPDVRGLTITQARDRLSAVALQLDPTVRREPTRGIEEGLIVRSDPGPWEKVERGSTISITVSSGTARPDRPIVPADSLEKNTWSLQFTVRSDMRVIVRVEMTDARGEPQIVYESEHENDDVVDLPMIEGFGKTATFRVYYNNNLEMTYPNRRGSNQ